MSLLNSYAGLSSAATGFVLGNNVLIIAGTLDGFSGFILSILMCRAMNRSITNVLFGGFGAAVTQETAVTGSMREVGLDDVAVQLAYANQVVFVPDTAWRPRKRNTPVANWGISWKSAASP